MNVSPILTDSGRYPRRFEIELDILADDILVVISSAIAWKASSAMPCKLMFLVSPFLIPCNKDLFLRTDRVSTRLEGLPTSWIDGSELLALLGESTNVGDVFGPVKEILLTMFLMIRGDDQLRSSLLGLELANCDAVGVTGKGDLGLHT